MEFYIHRDCELSHVPTGYFDERPIEMRLFEPGVLDYDFLMKEVAGYGYKKDSDLYHFLPEHACNLPEGMFLISGPGDFAKMISRLNVSKTCHLYLVYNCPPKDDYEWWSDMDSEVPILHVTSILRLHHP